MKKLIYTLAAVVAILLAASPVLAATTINLSPASAAVKAGQTFKVTITLNPQGVKNYTVKIKLTFPANLVEAKSFSFGSNWMPLSQAGYDLVDNVSGILVKTAGYPQGLAGAATFGTVTFKAKATGTGNITVAEGTMAFDAGNVNVFSSGSRVSVNVSATAQTSSSPSAIPSLSVSPTPGGQTEQAGQTGQTGQAAAHSSFATILTLGTNKTWLGVLVVIVVVALVACVASRSRRKNGRVE